MYVSNTNTGYTLFRRINKILLPAEKKNMSAILILNTVVSIVDILAIALLFLVIRFYTSKGVISYAGITITTKTIIPATFLFLLFTIKSCGGYYLGKYQYKFVHTVSARLSETALLQYLEGSYHNHISSDAGTQIRRIVYTPTEFAQFILLGSQQLFAEITLTILATTTLLLYSPFLALAIAIILAPAIFILSFIIRKKLGGIKKDIKTANEQSLRYLNEALDGYIESNLHAKNNFFTQRYATMQRVVGNHIADLQTAQGLPSRFFELFAITGFCLLIAATFLTGQSLNMITVGTFIAAAYKIIPNISRIINIKSQLNTYSYTLDELKNISSPDKGSAAETTSSIKSIAFNNISFSYNNNHIINGLNFDINTGSFIGISGDSGIGKTTLMNLLLGFLHPQNGDIIFNDRQTTLYERKNNWQRIAYVQQSPFLAQASILNNIVLFEEAYDKAKLDKVLTITGIHKLTASLPDGIHTVITEGGKNISGGQRQRIAIARALYKEADLLLFDEPFNELDDTTESTLLSHFQQLANDGKIIMLITHNKNSFRYCSKTIYLNAS